MSKNNESTNTSSPEGAAPYDVTEQVGHLLRKAVQRHTSIFQQNIEDDQLTAIQFVTLCALRDRGRSSQAELVEATAIDQATIRGIIDRLKARGLIKLSPGQLDRRKVIADLTPEGETLIAQTIPKAKKISKLTMGKLNPAEQVAILYLLQKMNSSSLDGE
ncbi:MarR family winged helix-turn-helix transcriptional regulator [Paenalcaligenes niemegkensis]|uniref:MarR family winged helix-turn-helix transcriptional regulator n=1 Tax=Paenalcaligenes niemegkensis TaxID=2895469 RepID=UPI001EE7A225|nr:MarR family winged helix-turn-helix transcriptional regulator [Paenalcaligenes niemegkensis]MCQ9617660.1 MarR family winged helix-turn-helix transcriptional regulator [Paenalcaligenes niemegkensis]